MAPHSSTLAWKIPWTEEPGGLQSMGVAKSRTRLSNFTFTSHFHALEKEMAPHSSVLAWRIPGTGEPGGLLSVGSQSQTQLKRLSSSSNQLLILLVRKLRPREGKCLTQDHTAVRSRVGTEAGFSCPWMLLTAHAWLPPAIRHPLWEPGRAACPERGCLRVHSPFLMKPCSDSLFHQVERSARCLSESPGS